MYSVQWFSPGNGLTEQTVFDRTELEATTLGDARIEAKMVLLQMKAALSNTIAGYNILGPEKDIVHVHLAKDF
jgi:hypothetical protein